MSSVPPVIYKLVVPALLLLAASGAVQAQSAAPPNWRLDASLYPYQHRVDNDVDFTFMLNGNLPGRFSYFSFTNLKGIATTGSARFDRSEQNLRIRIVDGMPFDVNLQALFIDGDGNDFYQAGLGWRINDTPSWEGFFDRIHFIWRATFHLKRWGTSNAAADAWALEHFYRLTIPQWSDRFYLSGFHETTYNLDVPAGAAKRPVVTETQIGWRFWKDFHLVAEYRRNDFRVGDEHNLAVGLEFKARW